MKQSNRIWYRKPAANWFEALPLGNGRIGAMVYGGSDKEVIQVDESTFWSGKACDDNDRADTKALLGQLRALLLEEKYEEADRLGKAFVGNKNQYGTNLPVGNLIIRMADGGKSSGEKEAPVSGEGLLLRQLDMESAVCDVSFAYRNDIYKRELFLSNPAQVLCMRLVNQNRTPFSVRIAYRGIENNVSVIGADQEEKGAQGTVRDYMIHGDAREELHSDGKSGVSLFGRIRLVTDGKTAFEDGEALVTGAEKLELYLAMNTTFSWEEPDAVCKLQLDRAVEKGYDVLKKEHCRDFSGLYNRVSLTLESLKQQDKSSMPTDERVLLGRQGEEDAELITQLFQFGRYVLISSSRENSPLPTHMGGIWNDNIYCRMDCTQDMHIDMNVQMQYWLASPGNLKECFPPLVRWVRDTMVPSGERTAKEAYGCSGFTAHVVSNPWGFTSLGWGYNWGVWAMGGIWTSTLLWEYYEYTQDYDFLVNTAYPVLRKAAEFASDYLFWDEKSGYFLSGPSYSPENAFAYDGKEYLLSLSATCDVIMIREIFLIMNRCRKVMRLAQDAFMDRINEQLKLLPPYQIGRKGQLQEWFYDFEEPHPHHRHTSHLLGVYPFSQVTPEKTPELIQAAKKTMEIRYDGFEITSWGMNMLMYYYARMYEGENAYSILKDIVRLILKPSLITVMCDENSIWKGTWELDGNTGLTGAICEMLVQGHQDEIRILPAIPKEWSKGKVSGLRVRGGYTVTIEWNPEKVIAGIYADREAALTFKYREQTKKAVLRAGEQKEIIWNQL